MITFENFERFDGYLGTTDTINMKLASKRPRQQLNYINPSVYFSFKTNKRISHQHFKGISINLPKPTILSKTNFAEPAHKCSTETCPTYALIEIKNPQVKVFQSPLQKLSQLLTLMPPNTKFSILKLCLTVSRINYIILTKMKSKISFEPVTCTPQRNEP